MMKSSELDKIAREQYKKALVRYITVTMGEAVGDEEHILQLYCRTITWYNNFFEGIQAKDSGSLPPPPPPPPPHH